MKRRFLLGVAAAAAAGCLTAGPALASSTAGTAAASPTALVPCSNFPGHYCAKVIFTSVSGGIRVDATKSTGYTTGAGKAREWFRYSCSSGTCYIVPTAVLHYGSGDLQLNVKRTFNGSGFFLPCGAQFGVDYINPAVNAPGPGPLLFRVTCTVHGAGHL